LQRPRHRVVDEPGKILDRHAGCGRRIGHDRQALDIEARDDRLVDGARQIGPDLGDLVFDVVEHAIDIRSDIELDRGDG
jgi:hypothetical protein